MTYRVHGGTYYRVLLQILHYTIATGSVATATEDLTHAPNKCMGVKLEYLYELLVQVFTLISYVLGRDSRKDGVEIDDTLGDHARAIMM